MASNNISTINPVSNAEVIETTTQENVLPPTTFANSDNFGLTPLHYAVENGNLEIVKYLVQDGFDLFIRDAKNRSLLHHTAKNFDIDVAKFLLEKNLKINDTDDTKKTAAHYAAIENNELLVSFLEEKGVDIDLVDADGLSVVHYLMKNSNPLSLSLLPKSKNGSISYIHYAATYCLEQEILYLSGQNKNSINLKDKSGKTPLSLALNNCKFDFIEMLLEQGADFESVDVTDGTPLFNAIKQNDFRFVKFLLDKGIHQNVTDETGRTPLHYAAMTSDVNILLCFLKNNINNIHLEDNLGKNALHYAASSNNISAVLLLSMASSALAKNETMIHPLFYACKFGFLDIVKSLVEKDLSSVHLKDDSGKTPLHYAALHGYELIFEYLVLQGAVEYAADNLDHFPIHYAILNSHKNIIKKWYDMDNHINKPPSDPRGRTFLHIAASSGDLDMLSYIYGFVFYPHGRYYSHYQQKLNIEDTDKHKRTPLHYSALSGSLEVVKFLQVNGANLKALDESGQNSLHLSAGEGYLDIVSYLKIMGLDTLSKDKIGRTPLHYAAENGKLEVVKILSNEESINIKDNSKITPIHCAVKGGNLYVVQFLVEGKADINSADEKKLTPVMYAIRFGHLDILKYLIQVGGNINDKDAMKNTILHFACENALVPIIKYLVEEVNLNIEEPNAIGKKPLISASEKGHLEVVEFLIDNGANINATDYSLKTSVHYAAEFNKLAVLNFLFTKGADLNSADDEDLTPLHYASSNCHLEITKFLVENGVDINAKDSSNASPLNSAFARCNFNIIKYLIDNSADVNNADNFGPPIYQAIKRNDSELIKYVISSGANVNYKDTKRTLNFQSPLFLAIDIGNVETVSILIENSANPNMKSFPTRKAPLHFAVEKGNLEIVKYLVDSGADLFYKDRDYNLPVDYAENEDIAKYLRSVQLDRTSRRRRQINYDRDSLVTSGVSKPYSFVNSLGKSLAQGIRNFLHYMKFPLIGTQFNQDAGKTCEIEGTELNSSLLLLNVLCAKIFGHSLVIAHEKILSPMEAQGCALNIVDQYEHLLHDTRKQLRFKVRNPDLTEVLCSVQQDFLNGNISKIETTLSKHFKKTVPEGNAKLWNHIKSALYKVIEREMRNVSIKDKGFANIDTSSLGERGHSNLEQIERLSYTKIYKLQ